MLFQCPIVMETFVYTIGGRLNFSLLFSFALFLFLFSFLFLFYFLFLFLFFFLFCINSKYFFYYLSPPLILYIFHSWLKNVHKIFFSLEKHIYKQYFTKHWPLFITYIQKYFHLHESWRVFYFFYFLFIYENMLIVFLECIFKCTHI